MPLNPNLQLRMVESYDDAKEFMEWLRGVSESGQPWIGSDTETGGLEWYERDLRTVQFGTLDRGWVIPWQRWGGLAVEAYAAWPRDIIFHNAKFDLLFLENNGVDVGRHRVHDSMLLARVVAPHMSAALKPTADRLVDSRISSLGKELDIAMMKGKWDWDTVPIELPQYWTYAALDPVITVGIWEALLREVGDMWRVYLLDLANGMVVLDMEQRGQMIDKAYCADWSMKFEVFELQVADWAFQKYGIKNLNSDADLIKFFQNEGVTLTKRTDKGKLSLDKFVLQEIDHPVAEPLLNYRQANKKRVTYFDSWLRFEQDARIHPTFNITGARTARMSSERPNLQNVPRSRLVRSGLAAKPGHVLVLADYDQIELRLMAHFSKSKPMIDAIHAGEDLHTYTAKLVYGTDTPSKEQRRVAKSSNFAKIYGAGLAKFALTAGIHIDEAQDFLAGYDLQFPEVRQFQQEISNAAHTSAGSSPDGLAHLYSEFMGRQQVARANEAYKLVNYVIQGTAADVLKAKMLDIDNSGFGRYMTIPIHDEIAFEVPTDEAEDFARELPAVMEDHDSFDVPLSVGVEIVSHWGQKYDEGT